MVTAFNKVDLLPSGHNPIDQLSLDHAAVLVSARCGLNIDDLLEAVEAAMVQYLVPLHVFLPYKRGDLLSLLHERGQVDEAEHKAEGIEVYARLPGRLVPYFETYKLE